MTRLLRVLLVEDCQEDALLLLRELRKGGYNPQSQRVATEAELRRALQSAEWDLVLSDYSLPGFGGREALRQVQESGLDLPFILVSGAISEEMAVEGMKSGAHDFVLKQNLGRLLPAVDRELREAKERRERRRAEAALRQSEQRQRLHFAQTPLGVIEWDANGRVVAWNPSAERIFGYAPAEARGKPVSMIVPESTWTQLQPVWQALLKGEGGYRNRNRNVTRDGRIIECEWYNTPLVDERGEVIGVTSLVEDITTRQQSEEALRRSEERFRSLVSTVPGVVFQFRLHPDGHRSFPFVSERVDGLVGVSAEAIMRDPDAFFQHMTAAAREGLDQQLQRPLDRFTRSEYEIPVVTARGEHRWLRAYAEPTMEADGSVLFQGVVVDITERRLAEEAREQLESQLRQAQKMEAIGTLAGGIAHDFNNILAAIVAFAELARMDAGENAEVQESLANLLKSAKRAEELVRQILAFGRRAQHERRPLSLGPVVTESLKLLRSALPATIEILAECPSDSPVVLADPTQIHQVLLNLCTNAAHAMRGGVGRLAIALHPVQVDARTAETNPDLRPGPYVRLEVRDTGHGMDAATLKRIFDPFFTTKGPGEGTGLGLAVVHGIIKEHEGAIRVESQLGQGTTFRIYLPVYAGTGPAREPATNLLLRGQGEHVLFVDDEPALVLAAKRMLERMGYRVTAILDPHGALELFESHPDDFQLVITDMTMPGMTGIDLATRVLQRRPRLPVLLATGFSTTWTVETARALGIRDVVLKPLAMEDLSQAIRRVLQPA